MNTELWNNLKNSFDKDLLKVINDTVVNRTKENVQKYQNIQLVTKEQRMKEEIIMHQNQVIQQNGFQRYYWQ